MVNGSAFLSDWLWLLMLVPPAIGAYYLWTMVIYPWISKPDAEAPAMPQTRQEIRKGERALKKQK